MNGQIKKFEKSVYADFKLNDFIKDESNKAAYCETSKWIDAVKSDKKEHFHIFGECGNGKSHLAAGAINAVLDAQSSMASFSVNIEYLCRHMEEIPNDGILFCEGMWSLLSQYLPEIIEICSKKSTAVILTSDRPIQPYKNLCSVEIFAPTELLLRKIIDSKITGSDCAAESIKLGRSVRETLHLIRKEFLKSELASSFKGQ